MDTKITNLLDEITHLKNSYNKATSELDEKLNYINYLESKLNKPCAKILIICEFIPKLKTLVGNFISKFKKVK